jgi:cytoskeleton protein RodZ
MADSAQTLGEFLRQEREKRGVTIEQVASATRISVRLLHSLEADQYADLPAKPFVRGFVTSYCRFISLNPQETLTRFDDFIEKKASERPSRDAGHSGYAFEKREGEQSRTLLWIVMGVFIAIGAVLFLVFKPSLRHHRNRDLEKLHAVRALPSPRAAGSPPSQGSDVPVLAHSPAPGPQPSSSAAAAAPVGPAPSPAPSTGAGHAAAHPQGFLGPVPLPPWSGGPVPVPSHSAAQAAAPAALSPSPVASPSSPKPQPSPAASSRPEKPDPLQSGVNLKPEQIKYKLILKATEDVWVRYRLDDRPSMKFPLRKDRVLVLRAERELRLQVSNADHVTYNLNGNGAKPLNQARGLSVKQGNTTLLLAPEGSVKTQEPFPGEKPLPAEVPPPRNAAP